MDVHFFDVDHGACALIRSDTGHSFMIDCGHSTERNWRPSEALPTYGIHSIECLFVSNFDEDHVSDFPNLIKHVYVPILCRNPSVGSNHILRMKQPLGAGDGVRTLTWTMENHYVAPVLNVPDWGGLAFSTYWNTPRSGLTDTNNLSLVTFAHYNDLHLIFPGDLEEAGWRLLLTNLSFCYELSTVNVFVASHHGRRSGYCSDVFQLCRPELVIFSDKQIEFETQRTATLYRQHTRGVLFTDGVTRHVLTTRNNGLIRIQKTGALPGWVTIENK
jgi:beta-lactamase superfamily II metal-dependent hydrolase